MHAEGRRPAGIVSAYYIGRISRKQAYAVLLHMYTAMYGGSIENAAPLPVLLIVMACVCAPAAAIATECVCAPADVMLSECEWLPFVLVQPVHEREASKPVSSSGSPLFETGTVRLPVL